MIIFGSMNKFEKICVRIGLGCLIKKKRPIGGNKSKQLRRHLALRRLKIQQHIKQKMSDAQSTN